MELLKMYLRRERVAGSRARFDVMAYRDSEMTQATGRWPWYYTSKPRRNSKTVTLNCYNWQAVWGPDK